MDGISILSQRIDLLDCTYIGGSRNGGSVKNDSALLERVSAMYDKIESIGTDIPALKSIHEHATKLKPLIQQRKQTAAVVSQRIDQILAQRDALELTFKQVVSCESLSKNIDSEAFKEADDLAMRMESLDSALQPLLQMSREQAQEIDDLLNVYEQAMTVLSDVCCSWESSMQQHTSK